MTQLDEQKKELERVFDNFMQFKETVKETEEKLNGQITTTEAKVKDLEEKATKSKALISKLKKELKNLDSQFQTQEMKMNEL